MEKQTKVKITLYVIPIIVIALIVAVVALVITIRKMQATPTEVVKLNETTQNTVTNTTNTTNETNETNTTNSSKKNKNQVDEDEDEEEEETKNTTKKKGNDSVLEDAKNTRKSNAKATAKDALNTALASILTDYYSGRIEDATLEAEAVTAERLEEETDGQYIFEVSWNTAMSIGHIRMQLSDDEESPVYSARVSSNLTITEFETEED